jgi:hypothetical protein
MENLVELLKPFDYVVQRNWEGLPNLDSKHPDLDLFTTDEEVNNLKLIIKDYGYIDVRSPKDNYYPCGISALMLLDKRKYKGFWIPSPLAHFLSLFYHNAVHKQTDPYKDKLIELFLDIFPAVKCTDKGVGYYVYPHKPKTI